MDQTTPLTELGFSRLEAEAYVFLVANSPATGYRVAKATGKPTANTYKALESLMAKGAITAEDGDKKLYRAINITELLSNLRRQFDRSSRDAQDSLQKVQSLSDDDRFYHLEEPGQVFERLRCLLNQTEEIVLLDVFPLALERLTRNLEMAVSRGIKVAAMVYEKPPAIKGVEFVLGHACKTTLTRWPGQWCNAVFDGRHHLLAFLTHDLTGVHQALWSSSAYVSWVYHNGLSTDMISSVMQNALSSGRTLAEVKESLQRIQEIRGLNAPGYRELMRRYGSSKLISYEESKPREEE